MIYFPIIFLAIIQGLTEFLPISSSGHLVLVHHFINNENSTTALDHKIMDIAVHVGTLFAVMVYFWRDVLSMIFGSVDLVRFKKTPERSLVVCVFISSIPIIIVGFLMFSMDVTMFDSISVIAWTTLIFAILLYISDQFPQRVITIPTKKQAFFYGLFQCLALIPGVSRSGITMTIGRFLGHDRVNAARYSMLLGMVAILGAGLLTANSLTGHTNFTNDFWVILCVGAVASCITAYITIVVMMRWVKKASFTPFVIYRVILAGVLLYFIHNGMIPEKI